MSEVSASETSALTNTMGKECKVGRLISAQEGELIVEIAASWSGTPYGLVGNGSIKGAKGDCSGSSHHIYAEAGFPYVYQTSKTIIAYIDATHRFRKISGTPDDPAQPGDLIIWPGGHIAIYATFKDGDKNALNKYGKRNDMWSAYYPGGPAYSAARAQGFRKSEPFFFYRYFLLPGDPGCARP